MLEKLQENVIDHKHVNRAGNHQYTDSKDSSHYACLLLANYCMPTLLNIKPSNLICIDRKLYGESVLIEELNHEIGRFDCQSYILYENQHRINLLIYHEKFLYKMLADQEKRLYLTDCGYNMCENMIDNVLFNLKTRFEQYHSLHDKQEAQFPHEIGIILGYPLKDVKDFVRHQGRNFILNGCWKVYHNAEEAVRVFENYKKIRLYANQMIMEGKELKEVQMLIDSNQKTLKC